MKTLIWKHFKGLYLNKSFRVWKDGNKWWLSDVRNGAKSALSWTFKSAKEAKEFAEKVKINYI